MKLNLDIKKGAAVMTDVLQKTSSAGKKLAADVQVGVKDMAEKTKNENYQKRLKKYNPLFPEKYYSKEFCIPNMIRIVDDAERRGIDVCEGAIGWLSKESGMEVLHLYDEVVEKSGIQFIPSAICDAVYYVDNFDKKRFNNVDHIFDLAYKEKIAELKYIAYSLGAKKISIEMEEQEREVNVDKKKSGTKENGKFKLTTTSFGKEKEENHSFNKTTNYRGKNEMEFSGSDKVEIPELKWFKHDDNIKRLIEMRCNNLNSVKSEKLYLEGAVSAALSQKTASAIDGAISNMNGKGSMEGKSSMEKQAIMESKSKFIFDILF